MDSGMRQRRTAAAAEPMSASSTITETFKRMDFNPKTLEDFKEKTSSGATVSIVSLSTIVLLVLSELRTYMTPVTTDHLYVDTARSERIRININVTFPSMPCAGLKCAPRISFLRSFLRTQCAWPAACARRLRAFVCARLQSCAL